MSSSGAPIHCMTLISSFCAKMASLHRAPDDKKGGDEKDSAENPLCPLQREDHET